MVAGMIIDAHTHLEPLADYQGKVHSAYGVATANLQTYLRQCDENGVEKCFTFIGMGLRLDSLVCDSNDGLARLRDKAPDRIYPWGTVHPAWPEKKLRSEIRRVAKVHGFYGLKFLPILQGYPMSGKGMDIVAEEAIDLNLAITSHDGSRRHSIHLQR